MPIMCAKMIKITDLLKNNECTYSFEITPDASLNDIDNLSVVPSVEPLFYSVTWHAKSHRCENFDIAPLKLAKELKRKEKNVLLHLTCDLLKKDYLDGLLVELQENGICNLFVVLGESFESNHSDFQNSNDLIAYIRQHSGTYFCIGVAGFPDRLDSLLQLKEKIDKGADFILTQAFFEPANYIEFVRRCKNTDIAVPIIPGVFIFETSTELTRFANLCKVKVAQDFINVIINEQEITSCTEIVRKMLKDICKFEFSNNHFHIFTLNKLERVTKFIETL